MLFKYAILMTCVLSNFNVYSADIPTKDALPAPAEDPQQLNRFEVIGFLARPLKKKLLEGIEHYRSIKEIIFFLVNDRLEPQFYGSPVSENTKTFVSVMQQMIAEKLKGNIDSPQDIRKALGSISRHARPICYMCCDLERKKREGKPLGILWADNPRSLLPFDWVDAEKFYTVCCTDFYKQKSPIELDQLIAATKYNLF